ncbi:hypothetical protein JA13_280 [Dickeya phage vB_DsoM_JA13]|uniref:Uncharacterized protein n=1 Tax=Dickeya phage vB_DsoM_JA13 TaxID=2283030 RepID=A0A384ZWP8_9CAUD|nr:hypothetical protein JA13_280 [Dickeya phage vB_DsoM_JA13]
MKISSIVLSAILFATVQQSYASESVPKIFTQDLALTKSVDARCQKTYAGFEFLQGADLDFGVSSSRYETRPMWPLICSLSEKAVSTKITKESYGVRVVYVLENGSTNEYDFVNTIENAFEVAAFNGNMMDNYKSQNALLDVMTVLYKEVMEK